MCMIYLTMTLTRTRTTMDWFSQSFVRRPTVSHVKTSCLNGTRFGVVTKARAD